MVSKQTPTRISHILRFFISTTLLCSFLVACAPKAIPQETTPTPMPTSIVPVKPVYKVSKGDIVRNYEFSARVVPVIQASLYFKTSGRVNRLFIKKGDQVKAGDLIANLEGGNSQIDERRAEINVEIAKLNLKQAELETPKWAWEYPIITSLKNYEIELAQLDLDEIKAKIDETEIRSPIDGKVLSVSFSEGDVMEAYKVGIIVADVNQLEFSADLVDRDMQLLTEGQIAQISPSSSPGKTITGAIRRLPYPYGKASQGNALDKEDKTTRIIPENKPQDINMSLGDLARVVVTLERKNGVLWLPPQAIRKYEGRNFVIVQQDGELVRTDVKIGISSNDRVEIVEGLTEGQIVAAP
jgi:macrolide-specific efflux system membrane fusion protein